jgi:hypothetical protein
MECRAFAGDGFYPDAAAMTLYDLLQIASPMPVPL